MAVTEMSGKGYALYGGMMLPDIASVWDRTAYPYAYIQKMSAETTQVNQLTHCLYLSAYPIPSVHSSFYLMGAHQGYVLFAGASEWMFAGEDTAISYDIDRDCPIVWTNDDLENADGTGYLAASDPISLEGMRVTVWDGDTTGLTPFGMAYRVADYFEPASAAAVYCSDAAEELHPYYIWTGAISAEDGVWEADLYALGISDPEISEPGVYFTNLSGGETYRTMLLARPDTGGDSGGGEAAFDMDAFLTGLALGLASRGSGSISAEGEPLPVGFETGRQLRALRTPEGGKSDE